MTEEASSSGFREYPAWLSAAGLVVLAQAGLALALFGSERPWAAVTDERPVLSGRHPLHQYHGALGAEAFRAHRTATCYDPAFQAGYPKTPVFDGGSRPAELFVLLGGGGYHPAAYKLGVFGFLLFVPVAFMAAARGAGLPAGAAVLAGCVGVVLGWSPAVRHMLVEGDLDFLLAGLSAVVFVPWLGRYAQHPSPGAWLMLAGLAVIGWYAHPLVWLGLGMVVFVQYLVFAPRHGPAWHLGLAGITCVGIAPNLWWLIDWGKYWWLRQPSSRDHIPLPAWEAVVGQPGDYVALCLGLPGGPLLPLVAAVGIVLLWLTHHRTAAGLGLVAALLTVAAARLAAAWPRVPADVPGRLAPLAAGFLVPAATFTVWEVLRRLQLAGLGTVLAAAGLGVVAWADGPGAPLARGLGIHTEPLAIGFTTEQKQLLDAIRTHTTAEARILWNEIDADTSGEWSALLPLYTGRAFIGGLDTESGIDHAHCAFSEWSLNGRPLAEWTNADLTAYCWWYNIGWVVCRSASTADRWKRYPAAREVVRLTEAGRPVVLFAIDRPKSFILNGHAVWASADSRRVVLTDVRPSADGEVHLSLHYFEGLRVYPSSVRLEPLPDPTGRDPIHHIRLRTAGPVPRITLVWEHP